MASTSAIRATMPPVAEVHGIDPERCVLDSFRAAITFLVHDALPELSLDRIYEAVDYGKKGEDFTIALPRFRLKAKPDELAKKIIDKVSVTFLVWVFRSIARVGLGWSLSKEQTSPTYTSGDASLSELQLTLWSLVLFHRFTPLFPSTQRPSFRVATKISNTNNV